MHARLTPSEHITLLRVLGARAERGLDGHENPTEWIRAMLHEQATALGIELPTEYLAVRHVRNMNADRSAGAEATACAQCPRPVGECGVLCDACLDELLARGISG